MTGRDTKYFLKPATVKPGINTGRWETNDMSQNELVETPQNYFNRI